MTDHLTAEAVKARYGISETTLWRWPRNPELGFPKPFRIGHRRLWSRAALDAFDRKMMEQADLETAGADTVIDHPPHARVARRA